MRLGIRTKLIAFFLIATNMFAGSALWGASNDSDFTIYRARYRAANELVETARGLFPRARISAMQEKIVIAAPKSTTRAVLKLFNELDRKPARYRLRWRNHSRSADAQSGVAVEGEVRVGGVKVQNRSGSRPSRKGVTVRAEERESAEASRLFHEVEVLEGGEASLTFGEGKSLQRLRVKVRRLGNKQVQLELYEVASGANTGKLSSTVDIPLGKWREVGSANISETGRGSGILSRSRRRESGSKVLEVRVDEKRSAQLR